MMFGTLGRVKVKYEKRSFTTVLVPDGFFDGDACGFSMFLYFPEKDGAEEYCDEIILNWDGQGISW